MIYFTARTSRIHPWLWRIGFDAAIGKINMIVKFNQPIEGYADGRNQIFESLIPLQAAPSVGGKGLIFTIEVIKLLDMHGQPQGYGIGGSGVGARVPILVGQAAVRGDRQLQGQNRPNQGEDPAPAA